MKYLYKVTTQHRQEGCGPRIEMWKVTSTANGCHEISRGDGVGMICDTIVKDGYGYYKHLNSAKIAAIELIKKMYRKETNEAKSEFEEITDNYNNYETYKINHKNGLIQAKQLLKETVRGFREMKSCDTT